MPDIHTPREAAPVAHRPGAIEPLPGRAGPVALSYAQQRLWFLTRLDGVSEAYHMPLALELTGSLDRVALARALDTVVARHEALRTRFVTVAGEPVCRVDPPGTRFALSIEDLSGHPDTDARLAEAQHREANAPFDLRTGPLARGRLLVLAPDRHVLLVTVHHIVSDGWSMGVLTRELGALYAAYREDRPDPLPPLPVQYSDYAAWQRRWLAGGVLDRQAAYWKAALAGVPTLLDLPTDRPRPPEQDYRGQHVPVEIDAELTTRLKALAQRHGSTLFMTVLAGWALVLSRLSGQTDVVVGTPTANRRRAELEGLIGFFVNTLALRVDLSGTPTVAELLGRARDVALAALDHQDIPFEQVVELVNPDRSLAHTPLFQTMFAWQNNEEGELALPGVRVSRVPGSYAAAKFDMILSLAEEGGRIAGQLGYATALFDPPTAERYATYLRRVLAQMADDPDRPVDAVTLADGEERRRVLADGARTTAYPVKQPLHALFAAQVARDPDAVAVVHEDSSLTYGELNAQANRLAHHLRDRGVRPDRLVAVCLERSLDLVVALLAVLKAGGAYLPLDPAHPPARLAFQLDDASPVLLLAHGPTRTAVDPALAGAPVPVIDLDADAAAWAGLPDTDLEPRLVGATLGNLAYVIYTSGSTGQPKGVLVEHANAVRLFAATDRHFGFGPQDVWTLFHSYAFDFSVWEMWGALLHGGRLVVVPGEVARDPARCYALLAAEGVTVLNQTPSAFRGLSAAQAVSTSPHRLRLVIFGGEALDPSALRPWYADPRNAGTRLVNMYGITETTVHVTYRPLTPADAERPGPSPIGRPLDDLAAHVLDARGVPVPVGVVGELYVGGAGLARGYLNRPELTARRFADNPFLPGDRLYRTGDLVRRRADGELEYLGRNDSQVKIRGFRIELGEVGARLTACPGVRDAVVLAREDRLVGYYTTVPGAAPTPDDLRARLATVLPEHMVPAAYVAVAGWPLTANGKLDEAALPAPDDAAFGAASYAPPETPVEEVLAGIWAQVLGVARVGRYDHFFALGGHSLLALRVLEQMRQRGLHADVRALFATPTLASFAAAVGAGPTPEEVPPTRIPVGCDRVTPDMLPLVELTQEEIDAVVATVPGGAAGVADIYPLAPVQEGILFHHLMAGGDDPYLVASLIRFTDRARLDAYRAALDSVVSRHDVLRSAVVWQGVREPVQVVWRAAQPPVEEVALDPSGPDAGTQLKAHFRERYGRLPLDVAPLLRLLVAYDPRDDGWYALELIHHIADDNTSLKQLAAEIHAHLYGHAEELPTPLPFRDFVARTRSGPDRAAHQEFFAAMLGDVDTPTAPFGLSDVHGGGPMRQARLAVDPALSGRARDSAARLGVGVTSLFHVAWGQVLARCADRSDVVFGTVLSGRMHGGAGTERVLGPFINTLPLRVTLGATPVADCVRRTHDLLTELIRHEHASLALAQRASAVAPPAPLFTALLNYRHAARLADHDPYGGPATRDAAGITVLWAEETGNYPLALDVDDRRDDFALTVAVRGTAADPRAVCAMAHRALETLIAALEQAPDRPTGELDVLPPPERDRLLAQASGPAPERPRRRFVHQLVEAHAGREPDAVAVVAGGRSLTYGELNARANRLAHHLRRRGVGPDRTVALCAERSPEMVIGLLAVLKAGGAYVPLDPAYPPARLAAMLEDSAPVAVLTHAPARARLDEALAGAEIPVVDLDATTVREDLPDNDPDWGDLTPDHLAYVIYTSGTTGTPNGVLVEHRQLRAVATAWERLLDLRPGLVHLQMASLSFDVCTADLVRALGSGGRLVLCPRELLLDGAGLYDLIQRHGVGFGDFVPAVLTALVSHVESVGGDLAGFQTLVCGSEAWPVATARRTRALCGPAVRIVNAYGVTEAAVDTSHYPLPAVVPDDLATLPIGRPLPGTGLYLLDSAGRPVPDGATGEIYIGGAGVARGYLNRPELTAQRFVTSPDIPDQRLYRTGDLARRLPGGDVEVLGRRDLQLKIRGFRVEPGEIEARLLTCPGVGGAVVTGTDRLVAYYLADAGSDAAPDPGTLRAHAAATLPEHLVPAAYVRLDAWPLTPNGKLDRAALPAPDDDAYQRADPADPVDPREVTLAAVWAEVLGRERVGRHDDFFALGGHSLLAMRLAARIQQALGHPVSPAAVFAAPTVAAFAAHLDTAAHDAPPRVIRTDEPGPLPPAQQRLWFLAQTDAARDAYHMPQAWELAGPLDVDALAAAWDALTARHEALRTRFDTVEGTAVARLDPLGAALRVIDLTGVRDAGAALIEARRDAATAPFDLANGPLARADLVTLAPDRHVLLLTVHHIVSDGWSVGILTRELGTLYAALRAGEADPLPPLPVRYSDYAAWQRGWLTGEVLDRQAGHWTSTLAGAPAQLALPTDRPRPAEQDYRGGQLRIDLDADLTRAIDEFSRAHGGTVFMTLVAAWALVLSRLSGQVDVVVGTPTAGRRRAELDGLVGFFVNTLALRLDLSGDPSVADLLRRARSTSLAALDHQDIPFEQVVELVNPARSLATTPLFQTMLAWQQDEDGELALPGVRAVPLGAPYTTAKFDLTLSLSEEGGRIRGALDYATALFDPATVERYATYLHRVLTQMVAGPDRPVSTLALLDEAERRRLLLSGDATGASPYRRGIHELFASWVARTPDAVAAVHRGRTLTYADLDARATRLAHHLRGLGAGPDRPVAVCVERSADMLVGLLAILKTGAPYVPLDPAYPADRLAFMLADSAAVLLLTESGLRATLPTGDLPVVCLDTDAATWADVPTDEAATARHPDHLAYVIYTSGSTGRPKGVAQTWRCADNLVDWMIHHASPDTPPPARVLQYASTSFDVSFQEIWSTLCTGATLVLTDDGDRADLARLRRFIADHDVRRAFLPAAVLQQVATLADPDTPRPPNGCEIVTAGEALRITDEIRALVADLGGDRLYNHYGPTETHAATHHILVRAESAGWPALPPIGRPISGARVYLLDARLEPVPAGVVGEVWIAGAGLARGYLNRPAMTAERFLPDPFGPADARMYRSGDLARWLPDGSLDYVGRADTQVKIRGFRVEPGEVETVLQDVPGVREAAVLVREDAPGDRHLVAYLAGDATVEEARAQARLRLPEHMVPTRWVSLDRLPLTPNGKLDRRALPVPAETDTGVGYVAPRTPYEAAMAAVWADILRRERVGAHDDFFALGGHSLLATRLVHAINQRMDAGLSLRDLFRYPVLADLARHVAEGERDAAATYAFPPLVESPDDRYLPFPLTDIQEAYWVGRESTVELGGVAAHGYSELRLGEFDPDRFTRAIDRLVARHDMLRAVFAADGTQRVLPDVPGYELSRLDLRGLDPAEAAGRLDEVRHRMSHQVLDAGRWPLFEFALTELDDETRLHVSIDGLIVDVASGQILERELAILYADPDADLPPLPVTFRDYVLAERALRDTPRYERALSYWRDRAADLAPAPALPLARTPESIEQPRFTRYDRWLPAPAWADLTAAATRYGVTPSVLLLTAYAETLVRWSDASRFTLSLPLFNRMPLHPAVNGIIGDFTSLVLVEVDTTEPASFADRARAVQERLWQDIDHAAVSGVRVNREHARLHGTAQAAMPIVFNSTLSELAPDADDGGLVAALGARAVHSITQTPQVWIDHTVLESSGRLYYNWDAIDELFPDGMVAAMFAAYGDLLDRLADPEAWQVPAADLLPGTRLDPSDADLPATAPLLHELFDRRAVQAPEAFAVFAPDRRIAYGALRREARALAARLQERGVRPGDLVAVLAARGWEQVTGTLAVLYAGGAYLPVDPAWPAERIAHLLERTGARLALIQPAQAGLPLPDGVEAVTVDPETCGEGGPALAPVERDSTDLAYVIYTSGSTGTPKGVMIDHRGAVNTLLDVTERFGVGPSDRVLAISSLSFDLSVFDIFGTLSTGAAVVTVDPDLAGDPAHWLDLVRTHRVSVWNSVPALLGMLVEYAEAGHPMPDTLRLSMLSGDWIPLALPDRLRALRPGVEVHSLGGATEASIWSIHFPVGDIDPAWRSIPYGWPLRHQSVRVLDEALRRRPVWAVGHLYIGGAGLALGYWRDEATTAASFVTHPDTGERLYRTGDLGRLQPDGTIEFLGRRDGQVKIHGYRVELGEIEAALASHPAVKAAAARVFGPGQGDKRLVGYVVTGDGVDAADLAAHLAERLPAYMVPATFTVLDALPLSANGKVDRSRLPEPATEVDAPPVTVELDDPAEARLVEIVEGVLGHAGIAPDANLLRLGATSLDVVRIANALAADLGFRPRIAHLMRQPTLADLLRMYRDHVRGHQATAPATVVVPVTPETDADAMAEDPAARAGGVVEDPAARAEFKAQGNGRRLFTDDLPAVPLAAANLPADARRYASYRSVRRFAAVPMDPGALAGLLASLAVREVDGAPKLLYGSAGGAYPVQAYLYVKPGRVAGVPGGAYYYDPHAHRLVELGRDRTLDPDCYDYFVNRPVYESGAFALFLVAEMSAIEPLYGAQSLGFCRIEAGAMAQLLTMVAVEHGLGLCGIGSLETVPLEKLFDLGPTHRLIYSMVGGVRPDGPEPEIGPAPGDGDDVEMEDVAI